MTAFGWLQILVYVVLVLAVTRPLGGYMTRVFSGERTLLSPFSLPWNARFIASPAVDPADEQRWVGYALAMLAFNLAGFVLLYALMRLQAVLPLNPQEMAAVPPDLAFNTAISFITNTNWQNYAGEATWATWCRWPG